MFEEKNFIILIFQQQHKKNLIKILVDFCVKKYKKKQLIFILFFFLFILKFIQGFSI